MEGGVFDSIIYKWDSLLNWLDEKGLPLKGLADSLEDKGIPSLPVFLLAAVIIVFAIAQVIPMALAPGPGSLTITVTSADGSPLAGASVAVDSADSEYSKSEKTGLQGTAAFEGVPAGKAQVRITHDEYFFEQSIQSVTVSSGSTSRVSAAAMVVKDDSISLYYQVNGAESATVYLLDSTTGVKLGESASFSGAFNVDPNREYVLRAIADGYAAVEEKVRVGENNYGPVPLLLVEIGSVASTLLHVEVTAGSEPVANAAVEVILPSTGEHLFSLIAGDDGKVTPVEVPLGSQLTLTASSDGYLTDSQSLNATKAEAWIKFELVEGDAASTSVVRVSVKDAFGNYLLSPHVALHERGANALTNAKYEENPYSGVAEFLVPYSEATPTTSTLRATAFKNGFLPGSVEYATAGEHTVALASATNESSGMVSVLVLDYTGLEAAEASVALLDSEGRFLGIPYKITGADGLQYFEGVPLLEVIAVAAAGGRTAYSAPVLVESIASNPEGVAIVVSFPLIESSATFIARDYYSGEVITGASITVGSDSCKTGSTGACTLKLLEGTIAAIASAAGYDDSSAELIVLPGADNSFELSMVSTAVATQTRLNFKGIYSLDGKRVNSVSPYTTYEAKYLLTSPEGLEFDSAVAHVRVGALEEALSPNGHSIASYYAFGARARRGSSYDQTYYSAQPQAPAIAPETLTIYFDEAGFAPQDAQVVAGSTVVFENVGAVQQTISAGSELQGVTVAANKSFSYEFGKTGDYQLSSVEYPGNAGTIAVIPAQEVTEEDYYGGESAAFKWVEFEYDYFKGTREITVQVRTGAPGEPLALNHRTAFEADGKIVRDPEDEEAGVTKPELLANTRQSGSFDDSFQGNCLPGVQLCYRLAFTGASGSSQGGFQARLGEEFKLYYSIYAQPGGQYSLTIESSSPSVLIQASPSERVQALAKGVVTDEAGQASGYYSLFPQRVSNDAPLAFRIENAEGDLLVEEQLSIRVNSESEPALRVSVQPKAMVALEEYDLEFIVTDAYGSSVEDALIMIGRNSGVVDSIQAIQTEAPGYYAAESVQPTGKGYLDYEVTAPGFKRYANRLSVSAPSDFFEASPNSLQFTIDSEDGDVAAVTIENKLSNKIRITATVLTATNPQYSAFSLSRNALSVDANQAEEAWVYAAYSPYALTFAEQPETYREEVQGRIRLRGRVGSEVQTIEVPFVAKTTLVQQSLDDLWQVSEDALDFQVSTGAGSDSQILSVTNLAALPLLVNQEDTSQPVIVSPLSLIIQPGETQDFLLTASIDSVQSCMELSDDKLEGVLSLYASFQGIRSTKIVSLKTSVTETTACLPDNGYSVSLPFDSSFSLPANVRTKRNYDSSITIQPFGQGGELFVVPAGASVRNSIAIVSSQSQVVFPASWVAKTQYGWQIMIPLQVTLELTSEVNPIKAMDNSITVELYEGTLTIRPGATLTLSGSTREILIPQGVPILFESTPCQSAYSLLPSAASDLRVPVELTLFPSTGSYIVSDENSRCAQTPAYAAIGSASFLSANQILRLPDGSNIAFTSEVQFQQLPDGSVSRVSVPAQAGMLLPGQYAFESQGAVIVALPMPMQISYSTSAPEPFKDEASGLYTLQLGESVAIQFQFNPTPVTLNSKQVINVPAYSQVTFLSGASAMEVVDPSLYDSCQQKFQFEDATAMQLPSGSITSMQAGKLTAIMSDCSSASKAIISTSDGFELYESPASKKIVFDSASFEEGSMDGAGPKTVRIAKNSAVTFYTCAGTSVELHSATLTVPSPATLDLPAGATWTSDYAAAFTRAASVKINFGRSFQTGSTKGIELELPSSSYSRQDQASVPQGTSITYNPVCDSAGRSLTITSNADYLDIYEIDSGDGTTPEEPIQVELNNDHAAGFEKYTVYLCLRNTGLQTIEMTGIASEPSTASAGLFQEALPIDGDHMHFAEGESYGGRHLADLAPMPGEQCNTYLVELEVPASLLDAYAGCIDSSKKIILEGALVFETEYDNEPGSRKVYFEVTIDPTAVTCAGSITGESEIDDKVMVSYSEGSYLFSGDQRIQFSFKGSGSEHYRYLSIVNNRDETVAAEVTGSNALACYYLNDGGSKSADEFSTGDSIPAGRALVLHCYPRQEGTTTPSTYGIKLTGAKSGESFNKLVTVVAYKADPALASIYSSTPLGSIACPYEGSEMQKCLPNIIRDEEGESSYDPFSNTVGSTIDLQICGNYYCTHDQVVSAYYAFLNEELRILDNRLKTEADYAAYAQAFSNGERPFTRSVVIHMTNTAPGLNQFDSIKQATDAIESYAQGMRWGSVNLAGLNAEGELDAGLSNTLQYEFKGCGTYIVTAVPYASLFSSGLTVDELRENTHIQITIKRAAGCEETLANAALLMPPDETYAFAGNDLLGDTNIQFLNPLMEGIKIGTYNSETDEDDAKTLNALYESLYRINPSDIELPLQPNARYEDGSFCYRETAVGLGASSLLQVGGCITGLATIATGFGARVAWSACTALARSTACFAIPSGGWLSCTQLNRCLETSLASTVEGLVGLIPGVAPAAGSITRGLVGRAVIADAAGMALATGAGGLLAGEQANPTLIYGGGRMVGLLLSQDVYGLSDVYSITSRRWASLTTGRLATARNFVRARTVNIGARSLARAGAGVAVSLLLNVEARPVRAELPVNEVNNYLFALHDEGDVSIRDYCYLESEGGDCEDDKVFKDVCDEDQSACLVLAHSEAATNLDRESGKGGYLLAAFYNDRSVSESKRKAFYDSIFNPNSRPLAYDDFNYDVPVVGLTGVLGGEPVDYSQQEVQDSSETVVTQGTQLEQGITNLDAEVEAQ